MAFGLHKGENSKHKSYQDRRDEAHKRNRYIILFIVLFVVYQFTSTFFIKSYRVLSKGMEPGYPKYSQILVSPLAYGPTIWGGYRLPSSGAPQRGEVVLTETPGKSSHSTVKHFLEPFITFVTFQAFQFKSNKEKLGLPDLTLKRIIGLPGDTIRMDNNTIYVKPSGSKYFLSEFETSVNSYETSKKNDLENWDERLPLSSHFEEITLKTDEYYVVGDNRNLTNDSRSFGTINRRNIRAKIVLRYWPIF